MRKILTTLALLAGVAAAGYALTAIAGEQYLGTIYVMDAGSVDNIFPRDGGAFVARGKVSIQPDVNAYVCVDRRTCTSGVGVYVPANQLFPTALLAPVQYRGWALTDGGCTGLCDTLADGGTTPATAITTGVVSVIPVTGVSATVKVFDRRGDEN